MKMLPKPTTKKISHNTKIDAVKIKTEFNGLGALKTLTIVLLIFLQFSIMLLSYLYLFSIYKSLILFSLILSVITCIYVLSTPKNGQVKATWIVFLLLCFTFGYLIYFIADEHIVFRKSKKRYKKIFENSNQYIVSKPDLSTFPKSIQTDCNYLYNTGKFPAFRDAEIEYFPSGYLMFESLLETIEKAKEFIFMEFFIVSNGTLLNKILDVLKEKVKQGVDVRIIYDDMGSHGTLKRKTKKLIKSYGIKFKTFNPFIPVFKLAMNFRDHRKIVVVDGKVAYTGGTNLADEYVNEKRMHGYWKDCGVKFNGSSVDSFTISFIRQWEFITKEKQEYTPYLNKSRGIITNSIIVPFVDGLDYTHSIGRDAYVNMFSNAKEKIYIMTPYFIPDETVVDLLKNKASSGVDVRIILPEVADKKLVYKVSLNNAEKLISYGVKLYTMTNSFVHSKIVLTEYSAIVGSINIDQRSFYQQFESAIYSNNAQLMSAINLDFDDTFKKSKEITSKNQTSNKLLNRITVGLFRIISPFM